MAYSNDRSDQVRRIADGLSAPTSGYSGDEVSQWRRVADALSASTSGYTTELYAQVRRVADTVGAAAAGYSNNVYSQIRRIADGVGAPNTYAGDVYSQILRIADTGVGPAAPALVWDANSADTTPNFNVTWSSGNGAPRDAAIGDVLRLQVSATGAGIWSDYLTSTLDAAAIAGGTITVTGVTPLASGTYDFRARLERGANNSGWSPIVSATVAVVSTAGQPIGLLLILTKAA